MPDRSSATRVPSRAVPAGYVPGTPAPVHDERNVPPKRRTTPVRRATSRGSRRKRGPVRPGSRAADRRAAAGREHVGVMAGCDSTAALGRHLHESTGTPSVGVYLQLTGPTGDFPPIVTGARSLGRLANRAAGLFSLRGRPVSRPGGHTAAPSPRPPPASDSETRRRQGRADRPVLRRFSTARPSDRHPGRDALGIWWPHSTRAPGCLPAPRTSCQPGPDPCSSVSAAWRPARANS